MSESTPLSNVANQDLALRRLRPIPGPSPGAAPRSGRSGHAVSLALLVVAIMVLASFAALGAPPASPATPAAGPRSPSVVPAALAAPTPRVALSHPAGTVASCQSSNGAGGTASAPARASAVPPPTTAPGPLFNSQVQPFASTTGPYAYVAAGAALRDQGYGLVNLTWPGGSTSNLVAAYMVWSILNDSVPPSTATLNGVSVTGSWTAYATPSPCWAPSYIYTFAADVTSAVVNGVNNVTAVPSSITTGANPWGSTQSDLLDEGVSLVAIYEPSPSTPIHQVTVYTGALPVTGAGAVATLNYSVTNASAATTTYIVADGQLPGNSATWNRSVLDANAFPGDDPKETTNAWSYGNLSDTKTFSVSVPVGSNNTTAQVSTSGSDCVTWVGQVLSVGVAATKGPYAVTFAEQGLPDGTYWNVTTHSTTRSGTVVANASAISFSLGNNTYSYTVGSIPGFVAATAGSFKVMGGPVYLRLIFHQLVYPVTFNETGLPTTATEIWWVKLTNATQGISENVSAYSPSGLLDLVGNGSYQYTAGEIGLYLATPSSGTLTVSGSAVTVTVTFVPPPLYSVTLVENGLPHGTSWGAIVETNWGYYNNRTTNGSFQLWLPNITAPSANLVYPDSVTGYSVPSQLYFDVAGAAETIDINYSALYTVALTETGLTAGTYWYASLTDQSTYQYYYSQSNTAAIDFEVPNGTYTFTVSPVWRFTVAPATGSVTVNGANATAAVVFSLSPTYTVMFNETGLPSGTPWSVQILLPNYTYVTQTSSTPSITFFLPNGSYSWVPSSTGYAPTPTAGYAYIYGNNVYASISFVKTFSVTFTETGLPSGSDWAIYFGYQYLSSDSSSIVFWTANGSFSFYAYDYDSYLPSPETGTLVVNGTDLVQAINYTSLYYPTVPVTFTETGLPAGTNWSVYLWDYDEWGTGTTLAFTEANGTLNFSVASPAGYVPTPAEGNVTVAGQPVTQAIVFTKAAPEYSVTFTESGLPSGSTWYVNISGGAKLATTVSGASGTTASVDLANGSYSYTASTSNTGYTTPGAGDLTVSGAALNVPVPFTSVSVAQYEVTFTESSLPSGSTWYVNVTGEPGLEATVNGGAGTVLSLMLPDGSYTFAAATSAPGWTTSAGGEFTVAGASLNEPVAFSSSVTVVTGATTYTVTFTETGLPNGATWYVNVSGKTPLAAKVAGTSGTELTVSLANGSYAYTAASSWKNWTTPSTGTVVVSGSDEAQTIAFTRVVGSTTTTNGASLPWLGIGIGVILVILLLGILLFIIGRRRKKEKEQPPAGSTPPTPPTAGTPPPSGKSP